MFGEVDFLMCHVISWLLLGTFGGAEPEQETVPWFQQMASKVGLGGKQIFQHSLVQAAQSYPPLFMWSSILYGGECVEVEILVQY